MTLRYLTIGLAVACAFGTVHAQTAGKADQFSPYTDGAKQDKFSPYTDGAKSDNVTALNPGARPDQMEPVQGGAQKSFD
ncbi:MAG: hypothetical protein HOQ37_22870, partial [Cupriavidus sp.]|nr:hypothetical protein [Cupriavidus sp.]